MLPDPLTRLVEQLQKLPGIGAKSAQRLAFHILKTPREDVDRLAEAMREVKDKVTYCSACSNITDVDPCYFCTSDTRDRRIICVVEQPENVTAIEKTREFKGMYHVLMGALSPLHGEEPFDGPLPPLLERLAGQGVRHVYLDGGAAVRQGLRAGVVDSLTLSWVPGVLGQGVPLFEAGLPRLGLRLEGSRILPSGLVQARYVTLRPGRPG